MYKLSKLAGSVIVATAALGGASAALADGYSRAPKVAYERPSDWSGVYFGLSSGYEWSSIRGSFPDAGTNFGTVNYDTGIVGAHLGVQHQFGSIVLGVEGNWMSTFVDTQKNNTCPIGGTSFCGARLDSVLTIGPRVGWAAGHWMPYVTGGYATTRFEFSGGPTSPPANVSESAGTRNNGWYIGGGVEWMVSPGWTAGLEYRHYELNAQTALDFSPAGTPVERVRLDPTLDTVTARVTWKFGRESAVPLK